MVHGAVQHRVPTSTAVAVAIGLSSVTTAGSATADEPGGKLSADVLAGYGLNEQYGLGVGVRAGYTLPSRVYVGAGYVYHFGITNPTPQGDAVYRVWLAGGEGGYEIPMGSFVVRPFLGLGLGAHTSTRCIPPSPGVGGCMESTNRGFAVWPGVSLLLPVGVALFGVDLRSDFVTGDTYVFSLLVAFASAGVRF